MKLTSRFVNKASDWLHVEKQPIKFWLYKLVCEFYYELSKFGSNISMKSYEMGCKQQQKIKSSGVEQRTGKNSCSQNNRLVLGRVNLIILGYCLYQRVKCLGTSGIYTHVEILTGKSWEKFINYKVLQQKFRHAYNFHSILRHMNPLEILHIGWSATKS